MSIEESIYAFRVLDLDGNEVMMKNYDDDVLMIVNTASKGNGKYFLKKLQKLQDQFQSRGFVVLAFPCRQFLHQESKKNEKIKERYLNTRKITFPVFGRIKVNGKTAHPMFKWLKEKKSGPFGKSIGWNFTMFLVYADGITVKRFESSYSWGKLKKKVERAIQDKEWKDAAKARIARMNAAMKAQEGQKLGESAISPEAAKEMNAQALIDIQRSHTPQPSLHSTAIE